MNDVIKALEKASKIITKDHKAIKKNIVLAQLNSNKRYERERKAKACVHFLTDVPNSKEGWAFINQMKKYLHKGRYSIRLKGRGSRKIHGNQSYIPLKYAERYSMYIDQKIKDINNTQFFFERDWKRDCALRKIRDEINELLK